MRTYANQLLPKGIQGLGNPELQTLETEIQKRQKHIELAQLTLETLKKGSARSDMILAQETMLKLHKDKLHTLLQEKEALLEKQRENTPPAAENPPTNPENRDTETPPSIPTEHTYSPSNSGEVNTILPDENQTFNNENKSLPPKKKKDHTLPIILGICAVLGVLFLRKKKKSSEK